MPPRTMGTTAREAFVTTATAYAHSLTHTCVDILTANVFHRASSYIGHLQRDRFTETTSTNDTTAVPDSSVPPARAARAHHLIERAPDGPIIAVNGLPPRAPRTPRRRLLCAATTTTGCVLYTTC
ncbi:hypothetical protein EVAR_29343_1 [Eumeta japonica]|uniref:Uncharacterized protein n=1 Tax=Eumeta variegata TaxID=151549 RepID=A0A4C1WKD7_EUMVA|nr:hypothetical protein EVAR_29343_1 [Eumeta japonica]